MSRVPWGEALDQDLLAYRKQGLSLGLIAKKFAKQLGRPVTRNQVCGRAWRLRTRPGYEFLLTISGLPPEHRGLSKTGQSRVSSEIRRKERERKAAEKAEKKALKQKEKEMRGIVFGQAASPEGRKKEKAAPGVKPPTKRASRLIQLDGHEPVPITELGSRQCRAPIGEGPKHMGGGILSPHLFCGARTDEGQSWCEHHRRVIFDPRRA